MSPRRHVSREVRLLSTVTITTLAALCYTQYTHTYPNPSWRGALAGALQNSAAVPHRYSQEYALRARLAFYPYGHGTVAF